MPRSINPLVKNVAFLRHLPKLNVLSGLSPGRQDRLIETQEFGPNPGNLRMLSFVPERHSTPLPLVVVLHGCTQNAAGYDIGAGWSALAERYGFALLMPEQRTTNNPNACFNWFQSEDIRRNSGEAQSIRSMVMHLESTREVDPGKIFVTGLSAGGAMTSVMLATYPDIFAGGAIIAGLPYGVANNVQTALSEMHQPSALSPKALGDLVRGASNHRGPWPRISVWHGSADRIVNAQNSDRIVQQWNDVHKTDANTIFEDVVDGYPRQKWLSENGDVVIESYTIANMAHGTPLGVGDNDEHFGVEGAYLIDCGISSTYHIAKFFGLTSQIYSPAQKTSAKSSNKKQNGASPLDVGSAISRALAAAGLIK